VIDPEEAARRASQATDDEDMAGLPTSDADRALAEGGAATDAEDVEEAALAADTSPPPSAVEPGVPPTLRDEGEEALEPNDARADTPEPGGIDQPTVEHPVAGEAALPASEAPPHAGAPSASTWSQPSPPIEAPTAPAAPAPADFPPRPPGFAIADIPKPGHAPLPDAEAFIERAIESVLEQVPDLVDEEPEGSAKLQPWAETAAPPSKNKRPLSELLEQYAARVAAAPEAVAGRPRGQHPIAAFFARFTPQGGGGRGGEPATAGGGGGRRKRRGKRGTPDARGATAPQPRQQQQPAPGGGRPQRPSRGRQDQRPQRPPQAAGPPSNAPAQGGGAQAGARSGRRRRRRRGGGGGGGGGGAPAPG
jgi:translation initiation factor IF-2